MLWFDNSKESMGTKIAKGIEYYEKKYGRKPDLVLVNPQMWDGGKPKRFQLGNIWVQPYRPVLPGHIWIGIEYKN
jgi:hypothetical protein